MLHHLQQRRLVNEPPSSLTKYQKTGNLSQARYASSYSLGKGISFPTTVDLISNKDAKLGSMLPSNQFDSSKGMTDEQDNEAGRHQTNVRDMLQMSRAKRQRRL